MRTFEHGVVRRPEGCWKHHNAVGDGRRVEANVRRVGDGAVFVDCGGGVAADDDAGGRCGIDVRRDGQRVVAAASSPFIFFFGLRLLHRRGCHDNLRGQLYYI